MSTEKLIRMANQVAEFFRSYPEEQAVAGVRDHLLAFWTPRMRQDVLDHADRGGEGFDPLVAKALAILRAAADRVESAAR
ncbi:formate dehydrogenase subunit delta [Microvirga thermotolerans]|uniref:Formate dehydrogenase n=1 Tax=Microvirga thermotolerans TaxID=2651334 RepID=A0A5P9K1A9_9HYPH|nr:formate dehydrogenase subunit delta [Microvirga thermotolerans]QFU17365.1 formate dehydrogenase [Microvirga thermotolerans]